jgi:AraC-like DNA-binding protein
MGPHTCIRYGEHRPPAALADVVQCFWTVRSSVPIQAVRQTLVLPDGCTDIIFNFGDAPERGGAGGHGERAYAVGTMTRAVTVGHTGDVDILGVRFRPGAGPRLLRFEAAALVDGWTVLDAVWPDGRHLWQRLAGEAVTDRTGPLRDALVRARVAAAAPDRHLRRALGLIEARRGAITVEDLSTGTGVGRRQLERLFIRDVGVSPKAAARIARVEHALQLLRAARPAGLAGVAAAAGFFDQAHMTREVRRVTGVTPAAFRRPGRW